MISPHGRGSVAFEDVSEDAVNLGFREGREEDLDRLVALHTGAYPDTRGHDARRRNFTHNPLGELSRLIVAQDAGSIVGHAFLFPLESWFGGQLVKTGAIASLAVAPEMRGRGVARGLLAELEGRAHAEGNAVTMLYPFREGFYAKVGYATVSSYRRLSLHPGAIPRAWSPPSGAVRGATGTDSEALFALHMSHGCRGTGAIKRPIRLWQRHLQNERRQWLVLDVGGQVAGYVTWTLDQAEPHSATTLHVEELVGRTDADRRALFGALGNQRDQVARVEIDLAADDPIDRAFVDVDRHRYGTARLEHERGRIATGPMVRLLDPRLALEARGYWLDGGLDVSLSDGPRLHLEVREGQAVTGDPRGGPTIHLSRASLSAVAFGALLPSSAARLGWLTADDPSTLQRADSLFSLPAFFSADTF